MKKKIAAVGLAAGLVAGGAAGLILELSGTASASDDSTFTTDESTSTTDETTDHEGRLQEILQPLVDEGTLTADQVEAVITALGDAGGPMGHGGHRMGDHEMGDHMDLDRDDGSDTDADTPES